MSDRRFKIQAPLQDFCWCGDEFEIAPGIRIQRLSETPLKPGEFLSNCELNEAKEVSHWLCFEKNQRDVPRIYEIHNLFLLSLWIVKPTKSQVRLRLVSSCDGNEIKTMRVLERFTYLESKVSSYIDDSDIEYTSRFYKAMSEMCCNGGRLNNALRLTLSGCYSGEWQAALICYSAALEALLTYSKEGGITDRLAATYACLVEVDIERRASACCEFGEIYSSRSDVMHGRSFNIENELCILHRCQLLLRRLWKIVCSCPEIATALEGSDSVRKSYFEEEFGDAHSDLVKISSNCRKSRRCRER